MQVDVLACLSDAASFFEFRVLGFEQTCIVAPQPAVTLVGARTGDRESYAIIVKDDKLWLSELVVNGACKPSAKSTVDMSLDKLEVILWRGRQSVFAAPSLGVEFASDCTTVEVARHYAYFLNGYVHGQAPTVENVSSAAASDPTLTLSQATPLNVATNASPADTHSVNDKPASSSSDLSQAGAENIASSVYFQRYIPDKQLRKLTEAVSATCLGLKSDRTRGWSTIEVQS